VTVTLTYQNGDTARLPAVQAIQLIGPGRVMIQTFGNSSVMHSNVIGIDVDPFTFERGSL
jgi:hypothetical protein